MTYRSQPIVCDKPATGHTSAVFTIAPGLADRPEMHTFHEHGQQPTPDGRKITAEKQSLYLFGASKLLDLQRTKSDIDRLSSPSRRRSLQMAGLRQVSRVTRQWRTIDCIPSASLRLIGSQVPSCGYNVSMLTSAQMCWAQLLHKHEFDFHAFCATPRSDFQSYSLNLFKDDWLEPESPKATLTMMPKFVAVEYQAVYD